MRYGVRDLKRQFPDDDAALHFLFKERFPTLRGYHKVPNRKCYANKKGHQIYPLKGTIFERTTTPLTLWLHALFLFGSSKNGVSAAELSRQLGVTYKCAFRMGHKIRSLMKPSRRKLRGIVEADETYFGGVHRRKYGFRKKTALMGLVERNGDVIAFPIQERATHILLGAILKHTHKSAFMMTDEARAYEKLPRIGYQWGHVKHGKRQWVRGNKHTNTIEGFWGHLKPTIRGTYRQVSKRYLSAYVNERAFAYNQRHATVPIFHTLLRKASTIPA